MVIALSERSSIGVIGRIAFTAGYDGSALSWRMVDLSLCLLNRLRGSKRWQGRLSMLLEKYDLTTGCAAWEGRVLVKDLASLSW